MKVLYIIGQLQRGGAEQQLYYLLKYSSVSATVIVLEENPTDGFWVEPIRQLGHHVIELERRRSFDFQRLFNIVRIMRDQSPDIIHVFTDAPSGLYGRLAALISRHQRVLVGERQHPSKNPSWYRHLKRLWLNRHVSGVVANAYSSQDYMVKSRQILLSKSFTIVNGIELERFTRKRSSDMEYPFRPEWHDKLIVGTVGSLLPKKAPDVFVLVAKIVLSRHPEARFVHIGKGPLLPDVQQLSEDLNIGDKIMFVGERFDVPHLLPFFDIFLLTSEFEGMPNVVMEAMASGLPCVVTDSGDSSELVLDGKTGFVVPVGDEQQLADRVLQLVQRKSLRETMGAHGFERIQDFDAAHMAQQYEALYRQILNDNN